MITNERQYKITRSQLARLERAVKEFEVETVASRVGSHELANAELLALQSEVAVLSEQLQEFEALKTGAITVLQARTLEELPSILVRARIARGLTQAGLARKLGLKEQQIQRYESEIYATASLSRLTEIADALELDIAEVAELRRLPTTTNEEQTVDLDWSRFPLREMYRRHWFEDFSGSLNDAKSEAETLIRGFLSNAGCTPAFSLRRMRVRSTSTVDTYALLAWECRVRTLGKRVDVETDYSPDRLDAQWFRRLAQMSQYEDGPRRAEGYLKKSGIRLVIEPHLPQTHLDGAALLHVGRPVIALTLRYDRLDNFWFVLMHELTHLVKHLRKGRVERIFDDIEAHADELEREADKLAGEALIPKGAWETALPRYYRTKEAVTEFAAELGIHPAIVAGHIRQEANNYVILSDMVGQGKVREQFQEVEFGQ